VSVGVNCERVIAKNERPGRTALGEKEKLYAKPGGVF